VRPSWLTVWAVGRDFQRFPQNLADDDVIPITVRRKPIAVDGSRLTSDVVVSVSDGKCVLVMADSMGSGPRLSEVPSKSR
jgi:hypothetical protein